MRHRIKQRSEERAYMRGFRAGVNGRADSLCPYKTNADARGLWYGGYREGREQYLLGGGIINITRH